MPGPDNLTALLYGGPGDGQRVTLPRAVGWPEFLCVNRPRPLLAVHYRHVGAGVYEHQGACVEFDHDKPPPPRCPDCGTQIVTGEG